MWGMGEGQEVFWGGGVVMVCHSNCVQSPEGQTGVAGSHGCEVLLVGSIGSNPSGGSRGATGPYFTHLWEIKA